MNLEIREHLLRGHVIPAHPLALDAQHRLDERRQRALTRYYLAAGAGGIAVGVHTTQFAIRDCGLLRPVLELASEVVGESEKPVARIAGVCGKTTQARREAELARVLGYDAALLSLAAWGDQPDELVLQHCREVAAVLPLFGFYLQPAVGGRIFSHAFWRQFVEIPEVVAIKIAPFNRYATLDVVRALAASGRQDIALYTGNDDCILADLLTPFPFASEPLRIRGGLLGQWAVWTRRAVEMLELVQRLGSKAIAPEWLTLAAALTDANAAVFDAPNGFRGCIAGIHEVLRRQGLLQGLWCLDPAEELSPGQSAELDRVIAAYPELTDDEFVAEHRDDWLR